MADPLLFESRSPGETRRLGQRLGRLLLPGDIVLLSGQLGAGKTVFVQGIARGLGVTDPVTSKSFVLLGEYRGRLPKRDAEVTLYHADLFRLEAPEEAEELAFAEYSAEGVLAVEWPERAPAAFPYDHLLVRLDIRREKTRAITIRGEGPRASELLATLVRGRRSS